jgi:hypothetical protein
MTTGSSMQAMTLMEWCQIDSGLGHQCDQPGNEIYRLEDDVNGAIPAGGGSARTEPCPRLPTAPQKQGSILR